MSYGSTDDADDRAADYGGSRPTTPGEAALAVERAYSVEDRARDIINRCLTTTPRTAPNEVPGARAAAQTDALSELKDSGSRRCFTTGAVRDMADGKGRFDLVPLGGILSIAAQMERGARKYGDRNWEKGMPLSAFANSALRHFFKAMAGYDDEPHWDAVSWNIACLQEGRRRIAAGLWPAEFDDLPRTFAGKDPGF